MKESDLQKSILEYLALHKTLGFFWRNQSVGIFDPTKRLYRKNNSFGSLNGVSDLLGILNNGRLCAIEVKIKGGKVSDNQKRFIDEVNKRGGLAFVAYSLDDVIEKIGGIK